MFLKAVKLYNSGDFRSSTEDMERALVEYLAIFARCLAGCEGAHEQEDFKDFYPAIAGISHSDYHGHPLATGPCFPGLLRPLKYSFSQCSGSSYREHKSSQPLGNLRSAEGNLQRANQEFPKS